MYLEVLSRENQENNLNIELGVKDTDNRLRIKLSVDNNDKIDNEPKAYLSYTYDGVELNVMKQVNSKQIMVGHTSGCKTTIDLNWNEFVNEVNKFCVYNSIRLWSY